PSQPPQWTRVPETEGSSRKDNCAETEFCPEKRSMHNKLATFLILLVSFAAIFSSGTYYVLSPRASQQFMAMGVYSRGGFLGYLSPATNSTVTTGRPVNWTISVTTNMASAAYALIIVRIANTTLS